MINVNSLALTEVKNKFFVLSKKKFFFLKMTNIVLPSMLKKNKGAVINLSSASSIWPSPLLSTYAGTKVKKFSLFLFRKNFKIFFRRL